MITMIIIGASCFVGGFVGGSIGMYLNRKRAQSLLKEQINWANDQLDKAVSTVEGAVDNVKEVIVDKIEDLVDEMEAYEDMLKAGVEGFSQELIDEVKGEIADLHKKLDSLSDL